jgi:hypothetical protein
MKAVDVPKPIQEAVEEALEMYSDGHVLTPRDVDEVRGDFVRFYAAALRLGLRGIRWNFGGCIVCAEPQGGIPLQRILLVDPRIVLATQGRAFGTVVCLQHAKRIDPRCTRDEVVEAGLRRIRHQPPKEV